MSEDNANQNPNLDSEENQCDDTRNETSNYFDAEDEGKVDEDSNKNYAEDNVLPGLGFESGPGFTDLEKSSSVDGNKRDATDLGQKDGASADDTEIPEELKRIREERRLRKLKKEEMKPVPVPYDPTSMTVDDFMNKHSQKPKSALPFESMQAKLDEIPNPVLGLEYIVEYHLSSGQMAPYYECEVCMIFIAENNLVSHVNGKRHNSKYMEKIKWDRNDSSLKFISVQEIAKMIEVAKGRQKMKRVLQTNDAMHPLSQNYVPVKREKIIIATPQPPKKVPQDNNSSKRTQNEDPNNPAKRAKVQNQPPKKKNKQAANQPGRGGGNQRGGLIQRGGARGGNNQRGGNQRGSHQQGLTNKNWGDNSMMRNTTSRYGNNAQGYNNRDSGFENNRFNNSGSTMGGYNYNDSFRSNFGSNNIPGDSFGFDDDPRDNFRYNYQSRGNNFENTSFGLNDNRGYCRRSEIDSGIEDNYPGYSGLSSYSSGSFYRDSFGSGRQDDSAGSSIFSMSRSLSNYEITNENEAGEAVKIIDSLTSALTQHKIRSLSEVVKSALLNKAGLDEQSLLGGRGPMDY